MAESPKFLRITSGLKNTMVTSDLRSEVEIWPFRACTINNMQYNYYYKNSQVIVDLAMGQIPHSTESISSCKQYLISNWCVCALASLSLLGPTCVPDVHM